jgi:hypothetical protein
MRGQTGHLKAQNKRVTILPKPDIQRKSSPYNVKVAKNTNFHRKEEALITPAQYRMARAALNISLRDLSVEVGIAVTTLGKIDSGDVSSKTLRKLRVYFQERGIFFARNESDYPGVFFLEPTDVEISSSD